MSEPRVIVLLISPLEDSFAVGGEISPEAMKSYRTLADKGMKVLFVTRLPLDKAADVIAPLDPLAPVLNQEQGLLMPEGSNFALFEKEQTSPKLEVSTIVGKLKSADDILIPIGIGRLPDHEFLNNVELAALLPGSQHPQGTVSVYQCNSDGPAGWSEWAETMMRRISIILNKSQMRQWNGT